MNNKMSITIVCLVMLSLCVKASTIEEKLGEILRANAPTNCAAGGCAIVYRVADGRRIATASIGELSPRYALEPGSVITPFTAIAAMEHGVAQLETTYPTNQDDPKCFMLPSDGGHAWPEKMSVADAIAHSSNIVLGKLGVDVGMKDLFATFSKFGIGSQGGRLPSLDHIDRASMSRLPIGQGLVSTPDEIARVYVILANRGKSPWTGEQIVTESTADAMAQVLWRVVSDEGTARRAAVEGVAFAGKTGTAQRVIDNKYVPLYNAIFVGFFPAEKPEYVVAVVYQTKRDDDKLYQGGGRSAIAFAEISKALLSKGRK